MQKIPYSHLHICGPVLFCARGGRIHSFRLSDGTHLSTWHHPDTAGDEAPPGPVQPASPAPAGNATGEGPPVASAEPPAKRQRLEEDREAVAEAEVADDEAHAMAPDGGGRPAKGMEEAEKGQEHGRAQGQGTERGVGKKMMKDERLRTRKPIANVPDRPLICIITSTTDRGHVLAVSGHDKTIWVFEHDGRGSLKLLSQRTMPKRPCSALISPDNQTILSADKFGDVYSLPLLPSATGCSSGSPSGGPSAAPKHAAKSNKPQATALTVHSKANRVALSNQLRMAGAGQGTPRSEPARFELTLQLGHVSMLTAMALARHRERGYIITADRDEHIRVSRFLPQAHVIEAYCLGHTSFVSSLAILPSRPDLLVSGGGDGHLFVWDWRLAKLRHKQDLLGRVREVCGADVDQVAVASLLAVTGRHGHDECARVVAICQDVPALFWWTVAAGPDISLPPGGIVRLAGNPLHIANVLEEDGRCSRAILVALDAAGGSGGGGADDDVQVDHRPRPSLVAALRWGQGQGPGPEATLSLQPDYILQDGEIEALEPAVPALAVRDLLYTTAILRKRVGDEAAAAAVAEPVAADVAEHGSAGVGRDAAAEGGGGGIEATVI